MREMKRERDIIYTKEVKNEVSSIHGGIIMIELLRKRRSIRKFRKEKIAPELIETIVEAALRRNA